MTLLSFILVWSFGCIIFHLLTTEIPFARFSKEQIENVIQTPGIIFQNLMHYISLVSDEMKKSTEWQILVQVLTGKMNEHWIHMRFSSFIFQACTFHDPKQRPNSSQLCTLLQSPIESTPFIVPSRYTSSTFKESYRMKLMVVGDSEAGKSTLIECIQNPPKPWNVVHRIKMSRSKPENRTVGIDLSEWKPNDQNNVTFNVWDFAGEEVCIMLNKESVVEIIFFLY